MQNLSNNKKRFLTLCISALMACTNLSAQIMDWVEQEIRGYIADQVNSVLHSTNNYLGSFGNTLWEGIVEGKLQGDLEEEMYKFRSFPVSTEYYDALSNKYHLKGDQRDYKKIYWQQSDLTKSFIYSTNHVAIASLGKGSVKEKAKAIEDSLIQNRQIRSLPEVLNATAMDSILQLKIKCKEIESELLSDIQQHNNLVYLFNSHPKAIRIYANSIKCVDLRTKYSHLLYWAEKADAEYGSLPKRHQLPNPASVMFVPSSKGVRMMTGENELGVITSKMIECTVPVLLNMPGIPNTKYVYKAQTYETDEMGRVVKITQKLSKETKGKDKYKSKLKSKNFAKQFSNEVVCKPYTLASLKYNAPDTRFNTAYYEKTKLNKEALKAIGKNEKMSLKTSNYCTKTIELRYKSGSVIPNEIAVSYNGTLNTTVLVNASVREDAKKGYISSKKNEEKSYLRTLSTSKYEITPKAPFTQLNAIVEESEVKENTPKINTSKNSSYKTPDEVICTAIANFLLNKSGAAVLTSAAKSDLAESTWPEVQCEVEGTLDGPSSFKDLRVYKTGKGQYKYECICPDHGDKYVDCCTIHASLSNDGKVLISHVTWDDANSS